MGFLMENYRVREEKIEVGGIPIIRLIPEGIEDNFKTIIFYHGLGSRKENQRMRGYILSSFGYQVMLPDALHHGERDPKKSEDLEEIGRYFWQAVLQNTRESTGLIDSLIEDYGADKDYIYVTGHSMGGFTAAGVLAHDERVRAAIPINGSFNWVGFNDMLRDSFGSEMEEIVLEEEAEIKSLDPMSKIEEIKDRHIFILHGDKDMSVNIENQREFFDAMKAVGAENIIMNEYEGLGHFTTTNMFEDILEYLEK